MPSAIRSVDSTSRVSKVRHRNADALPLGNRAIHTIIGGFNQRREHRPSLLPRYHTARNLFLNIY